MSSFALIISVLSICLAINHSKILFIRTSTIIENNTVNITIDTDADLVEIELSTLVSTPNVWKGFGFDSTSMFGTYAIIVDYTFPEQIPIVFETTLGAQNIGTVYSSSEITIVSDINDGVTRTVNLQRSITGTYSFPSIPQTFNMISAIGQQFNFGRCGGPRQSTCRHIAINGRNIKALSLSELTVSPTNEPSIEPTVEPTKQPSYNPTTTPTLKPTLNPTRNPTINPSNSPSENPSNSPTKKPSNSPIKSPTNIPTTNPSINPSINPTLNPTLNPSNVPSLYPTMSPLQPTTKPTRNTLIPTNIPTILPSISPTNDPSLDPTFMPTTDPLTIICDDTSDCNGNIITCDEINASYCNLECVSVLSCFETVFSCANNTDCNVVCNTRKSCESLSIIGGMNSNVNIECNADSSCIHSHFDAVHGNKLDIQCFDKQSCNEITMKCPNKQSVNVQNNSCKITAIGDKLVADKITIYAKNSWNDIDKQSYLWMDTTVEMFCNDNSTCTLQQNNASWNCMQTESLCFISDGNHITTTTKVSPTTISTSLIDKQTTLILTTQSVTESEHGIKEHILIVCDNDNPCDTDIICVEGNCRIICDSMNSCTSKNIYAIEGSNSLSIECNGMFACSAANIFAHDLMYLTVNCVGFESCKNTNFFGNNTNLLNIHCLHVNGSCQDMNVYCPLNHKACIITNDGKHTNDIHRHLDFYAIHGFNDLDISQYSATLIMDAYDENITNRMHCGINYESFCKLNASLFCKCYYEEIMIKEDTMNNEATITQTEKIAIIISAGVLATIVGFIGLCIYFKMKILRKCKDNKSYETVKINDNVNVELQDIQELQSDKGSDDDIMGIIDTDNENNQDYQTKKKTHSTNNSYQKV